MKKILKMIPIMVLTTLILCGCEDNKKEENNNSNNIDTIVFNDKNYERLEDINEEELKEYVKLVSYVLPEKSYDSFSDNEIGVVVSFYLLQMGQYATEEEISDFVYKYFNISDYVLKEGDYSYIIPANEGGAVYEKEQTITITITKENDVYTSNLGGRGISNPYNNYVSKKIKDNQIILTYAYGYYDAMTGKELQELVGYTKIYLEPNEKSLYIKKIEFEH